MPVRIVLILLSIVCSAQDLGRELGLPLLLRVPTPPTAVRADGKVRLVYELHIVNTGTKSARLDEITVLGPDVILNLTGTALTASLKNTGRHESTSDRVIAPGGHAVVFLWVTTPDPPPTVLVHQITGLLGGDTTPLTTKLAAIPVLSDPVVLRPPLRGEGWVAVNGPSNDTHHRRSWLALEGQPRVPQRFAIDFIRVSSEGQQFRGDGRNNASFLCYGAEVLAVSDGTVAALRDGIEEGTPGKAPPIVVSRLDDMEGNYISLRLGDGRFVTYAHLIPGSLKVRKGDHVKVGQVLGKVGNSGNSTGPHLHFQVGTSAGVLAGDGLPFVFDSFHRDRALRQNEIPLRDWLLHFH